MASFQQPFHIFSHIPWVLYWSGTNSNTNDHVLTDPWHNSVILYWSGTNFNNKKFSSAVLFNISWVLHWSATSFNNMSSSKTTLSHTFQPGTDQEHHIKAPYICFKIPVFIFWVLHSTTFRKSILNMLVTLLKTVSIFIDTLQLPTSNTVTPPYEDIWWTYQRRKSTTQILHLHFSLKKCSIVFLMWLFTPTSFNIFLKTGSSSTPTSKSFLTSLVDCIKDIPLVTDLTFLPGSFFDSHCLSPL